MKFPYGISHFEKLITGGYFYVDRTDRIPMLEEAGDTLLFIRPRRFGKSLLLSMLRHYYDILQKKHFKTLFGHLAIGKNPTPLHNKFLVLQWDFSCVDSWGTPAEIRRSLHNHVNACIHTFYRSYKNILPGNVEIHPEDSLVSLKYLMAELQESGLPLYLFIDEYDNFANEVLAGTRDETEAYTALAHQNGPIRTLFKAVKSALGEGGIERAFITGVSPVVMSDITSGFNIAENIYLRPKFNDLCGFTMSETKAAVQAVAAGCAHGNPKAAEALLLMRTYYNGYIFSPQSRERVFNPTLALYFLKIFQEDCAYPRKMGDANLAADEAKLEYTARIPGGRQLLLEITREKEPVAVEEIIDRFGLKDMQADTSKDHIFLASFLYYFGVLTIAKDTTPEGDLRLEVPNLVMRGMYVDRIRQMLLPEPMERDDGRKAAKQLYAKGDIAPLCDFVENRYFKIFRAPDYRWANELTVKTAFLTLLYNDILYIMDSERETGRGRADLTMIIRPDMRRYEIDDVLIEFKYVSLKEAGINGEQAGKLTSKALQELPQMAARMGNAMKQAMRYGDELEKKYKNLRLKRYAVVSLGFERIWGQALDILSV